MSDSIMAIRQLRRRPGFAVAAVVTLGLGIGVTTTVFTVFKAALIQPLPYPDADRLVMVWESGPKMLAGGEPASAPNFLKWRERNRVFSDIGYIWSKPNIHSHFKLVATDWEAFVQGRFVSASFFDLMGAKPLLGRTFEPEEDEERTAPLVVLSHRIWRERFAGSPDAIGQSLTVERHYGSRQDYTIVGVMPPAFRFPADCDLWFSAGPAWLRTLSQFQGHAPKYRDINVIARLKPGITIERAEADLHAIQAEMAETYPGSRIGSEVRVVPLRDELVGDLKNVLWTLLAAVSLLLLIACANIANLQLARAAARQREMALRSALGANRLCILRQLLTESLVIALAGGLLGFLLSLGGVGALTALLPDGAWSARGFSTNLLPEAKMDWIVVTATAGLAIITGVLFGLVPALQLSQGNLRAELTDGGRGSTEGPGAQRLRESLVVFQIALALTLLLASAVTVEGLSRLLRVNPGFQTDHLITGRISFVGGHFGPKNARIDFYREAVEKLSVLPGVASVCGVRDLPFDRRTHQVSIVLPDDQPFEIGAAHPTAVIQCVTPGYFETLCVPFHNGRDFDAHRDTPDTPQVVIVSQKLAQQLWPNGENPVGRQVRSAFAEKAYWHTWQVIGVVGDTRHHRLDQEGPAMIYRPYSQRHALVMNVIARTQNDPLALVKTMQREIQELAGDRTVFNVQTMEKQRRESVADTRFQTTLLGLFAASALFLAAFGIYSVITYSVSRQTRDIGIRMALGARPADELRRVIGRSVWLTFIGVILGLTVALAGRRVFASFVHEFAQTDPFVCAGIVLVLLITAVAAGYAPARRAANVDPIKALHHE